MADKINMSLDDIIKRGKKAKVENKKGTSNPNNKTKNAGNNKPRSDSRPNRNNRRAPVKNARVALANRGLNKTKAIVARRAAGARAQRRVFGARARPVAATGLSPAAAKKMINNAVKKALRNRKNITTTQVVRKRGGVAASTLRRTQAIKRNLAAARNVVQPVRTVVQRRAVSAPVRTIVQHVQPAPVRVIREVITAPPVETHVIRRGPPSQQARRNFPQQQRRNVVVQQVQQVRRFRPNNNRRDERPTVIRRQVVQQAPRQIPPQYAQVVQRVIQAPAPQRRFQQQPQRFQQQQQRFQRPQQGGNVRYVNAGGRPAQRNNFVQQVQPVQYRPVQYVTDQVVTSRGRGFRAY
uniref:FoP_duplication domain-containing protein n=1 Tax=Caenorhabditis tropicalis TaxID=1561998 RepID=A0A1I7TP18_9PELO